jgi:hypothetical protein
MHIGYPIDLRSADRKKPRRYNAPGLAISNLLESRCVVSIVPVLLSASSFLGVLTLLRLGSSHPFSRKGITSEICRFRSSREARPAIWRSNLLAL